MGYQHQVESIQSSILSAGIFASWQRRPGGEHADHRGRAAAARRPHIYTQINRSVILYMEDALDIRRIRFFFIAYRRSHSPQPKRRAPLAARTMAVIGGNWAWASVCSGVAAWRSPRSLAGRNLPPRHYTLDSGHYTKMCETSSA